MVTQTLLVAVLAFAAPANACDARADELERAIAGEPREGRRLDDDFDGLAEAARELPGTHEELASKVASVARGR